MGGLGNRCSIHLSYGSNMLSSNFTHFTHYGLVKGSGKQFRDSVRMAASKSTGSRFPGGAGESIEPFGLSNWCVPKPNQGRHAVAIPSAPRLDILLAHRLWPEIR